MGYLSAICIYMQSCSPKEIETYSSDNSLFFERYVKTADGSDQIRIDTVSLSFSDYVGAEVIEIPFTVKLIGNPLSEDKEYKVVPVPELTTAEIGQYTLPETLIFRKGVSTDTLNVTVHKDQLNDGQEVYVTLRLTANENFGLGYATYGDIKIRFNNKIVRPGWWNDEFVTESLFGEFSFKKLETIIAANPGFTTIVGMNQTEMRIVALNTSEYIKKHGITEDEEGEIPMEIPMY